MYSITAKAGNVKTIKGYYKNVLIAERHCQRLKKKYPGTNFKINRVNKKDKK